MNRKLDLNQRIFLIKKWWQTDKNYAEVAKAFVEQFPGVSPPCRQALYRLDKKFSETGSVIDLKKSGRPKSVTVDTNLESVAETFAKCPTQSARCASRELGISDRSIRRMLNTLEMTNSYKPQLLLDELHPGADSNRRVERQK